MAQVIDGSSAPGSRALDRLRDELVVWLTTVDPEGRPQSSVVWFLYRDGEMLVYSQPDAPKVRNIRVNPNVALNLNSDEQGNDMLTIEGAARIDTEHPSADRVASYLDKYRLGIEGLGMTPEAMARSYSTAILISPTRARYW